MNTTAIHPTEAPVEGEAIGRIGESAAMRTYLDRGYSLLARNWRCPLGEIDLVLARGGLLVFCEVKTRTSTAFGGGFDAVGLRKQRKLRQLAQVFLLTNGIAPARARFDVASVHVRRGGAASVELFEDAF